MSSSFPTIDKYILYQSQMIDNIWTHIVITSSLLITFVTLYITHHFTIDINFIRKSSIDKLKVWASRNEKYYYRISLNELNNINATITLLSTALNIIMVCSSIMFIIDMITFIKKWYVNFVCDIIHMEEEFNIAINQICNILKKECATKFIYDNLHDSYKVYEKHGDKFIRTETVQYNHHIEPNIDEEFRHWTSWWFIFSYVLNALFWTNSTIDDNYCRHDGSFLDSDDIYVGVY